MECPILLVPHLADIHKHRDCTPPAGHEHQVPQEYAHYEEFAGTQQ
jgi:hypothetical protein